MLLLVKRVGHAVMCHLVGCTSLVALHVPILCGRISLKQIGFLSAILRLMRTQRTGTGSSTRDVHPTRWHITACPTLLTRSSIANTAWAIWVHCLLLGRQLTCRPRLFKTSGLLR